MSGIVPTRLVHMTADGPRLVLTADCDLRPTYATLSHCWGGSDFLRLKHENMAQFLQSIPIIQLPKTFVDALSIMSTLGLKYIWIDSLCIIQDDIEDWRKEAALMSDVYGNSHVNIAASSAMNAHQGCFLQSDGIANGFRARLGSDGTNGNTGGILQLQSQDHYHLTVLESCLAKRAWAFQEKFLPQRTIHFGNRGMYWECASKRATGYLPQLLRPIAEYFPGILELFKKTKDFNHHWDRAVRIYSGARTTFAKDKLPAISGLVQRLHDWTGLSYLAGLWQDETIEEQLCWLVHPRPHGGPRQLREPSPA